MYRQGDLLFIETNELPDDAKKQKHGIIAEGEMTGHTHSIRKGSNAALYIAAAVAYVHALSEQGCAIDHPEHSTIELPMGTYKVNRQREYEPDGWRQVAD